MIRAILSDDFKPFGKLRIEFPPPDKQEKLAEVHLFTGINGTGKTRLLSTISAFLGNPQHLSKRLKKSENSVRFRVSDQEKIPENSLRIQNIFDANNSSGNWNRVDPVFKNSLDRTAAFGYSGFAYISDATITVMAEVKKPERTACLSFTRPETQSQALLQAITNLKIQAAMDAMNHQRDNQYVSRSVRLIQTLESCITEITGSPFRFHVTSYPKISLEVAWLNQTLSFDLLPDGLRSIIGWLVHSVVMMDAWIQGDGDPTQAKAIFLLDEIETHLHPAWQRKILPAFQKLFPNSQIFIATHSPFLIASLNSGWIHKFAIDSNGISRNEKPIAASEGDSYISVVEDILGVKEWYDIETEKMLSEYRTLRDRATSGDLNSLHAAREIALQIGKRSIELNYTMGKELRQIDDWLLKSKK